MGNEEQAGDAPPEAVTPATVESLKKTAQEGDYRSYPEQHEAVMRLWHVTLDQDEELQELAIRALNDLAWNHPHRGVASMAQDRLDRILKDGRTDSAKRLAHQAIRHELK